MTDERPAKQKMAARIAGSCELKDVRLLNCAVDLKKLSIGDELSYDLSISQKVERDEDSEYFAVRIKFALSIDGDGSDGDEDQTATVTSEFAALYVLDRLGDYEPTVEEFEAYAETAATMTLYPYAREFAASMTDRLGLPTLTLPIYRLPSPWHPDAKLQGESAIEAPESSR